MKILIGYDGSEYGEVVLEDLTRAGISEETEAWVLSVADVREIPPPPFLAERISSKIENLLTSKDENAHELNKYVKAAHNEALRFVERITESFPTWSVSAQAALGKPSQELINMANEIKPDLLVVGSHGRSTIGRLVLGSVSLRVLHEADCSVRISRKQTGQKNARNRVLLAVDGSPNSDEVVEAVAKRIWSAESEFRLVAVDDPFSRPEVGYLNWDHQEDKPVDSDEAKQWVETVVNKPKRILESAGLKVTHKIPWGDAGNMIIQETKDWNADAVFLGARGVGRLKRLMLGSVSSVVATDAECTVEIVKVP